MSAVCFGGSLLLGCGCKAQVLFPSCVCPPGLVHVGSPNDALLEPNCFSICFFVEKCHVKALGAGNSPCWPGNRDEEHRVMLDEHSPCPQIPLLFPMSHPPSRIPPSPAQANL